VNSNQFRFHIRAPRKYVYQALIDPEAIAKWKVPQGMTCQVHSFEPREGGKFRISLQHDAPAAVGKTSSHTDTYHGHFATLVPDERVVEISEFETSNPALQGEMTISFTLHDAVGGTDLVAVHDGLPRGVSAMDNELGWNMALAKLTALVEGHELPK
jgi:uncharacterized protein YndB with AHSA1/START domain